MTDTITDPATGKAVGIRAMDRMTGKSMEIRANKVVFAGGPFTDSLREMETSSDDKNNKMQSAVRGASGTHIVLPGYYCSNQVSLF